MEIFYHGSEGLQNTCPVMLAPERLQFLLGDVTPIIGTLDPGSGSFWMKLDPPGRKSNPIVTVYSDCRDAVVFSVA